MIPQLCGGNITILPWARVEYCMYMPGCAVAIAGELLHLRRANADDRKLGHDEQTVEQHQDKNNDPRHDQGVQAGQAFGGDRAREQPDSR